MNSLLTKLNNFTGVDKSITELTECYRRLYISRYIWLALFPQSDRVEANEAYNLINEYSKSRDISFCSLLGEIVDTSQFRSPSGEILSDIIENHIEYLLIVSHYIVYGDPSLEEKATTPSILIKAKSRSLQVAEKILMT